MGEGDYNLRIPIRHTGDFTKGQWISLWGAGYGQVRIVADYWGGTLLTDSSVCGETLLESGKTYKFTVETSATDMVVYIDGVEVSRTFENKSTYKKYDKVIQHNPKPDAPASNITPSNPEPVPAPTEPPVEPAPEPTGSLLTNG